MSATINKKEAYRSVDHLVEVAKQTSNKDYPNLANAIYKEVLPAYFPNQSDLLKRIISEGGDDLSHLLKGLTKEQIAKLHNQTKEKKDAAHYGLHNALEPSYTETHLKNLSKTLGELSSEIEGYQTSLVRATARAAQKEPIVKNSPQRPNGEAVQVLTKAYPESFNHATDLVQRLKDLILQIAESKGKVTDQTLKAKQIIDAKKAEIQRLSQKLSEEKNNLDNHDKLTKDWSSKYPYVTGAKIEAESSNWNLDNFSNLLGQLNEVTGSLQAYMLNEGQKCLKLLTGRRHAMQTAIGEMDSFKSKAEETQVRYDVTQIQLQQKMDSLQGLQLGIIKLEKQLQEKLDSAAKDSLSKLQQLVTTFSDYTAKANALAPYALTEEGKLREVRVLNAEKNEKYAEVVHV